MTEAFEDFKEDFHMHEQDAKADIAKLAKGGLGPDDVEQLCENIKNGITEARNMVDIMSAEASNGNADQNRKMRQSVQQCSSRVNKLKADYQRAKLMKGGQGSQPQDHYRDPAKDNIGQQHDVLDRTDQNLVNAQRAIAETNEVAINIDNNLQEGREQLTRAQANVQDARENTQEASGFIASLNRKASFQIILIWIVILVLVAAIIYMIYSKFIK